MMLDIIDRLLLIVIRILQYPKRFIIRSQAAGGRTRRRIKDHRLDTALYITAEKAKVMTDKILSGERR